jgi:hypothetical protein
MITVKESTTRKSTAEVRDEAARQVETWTAKTPASRRAWETARENVPGGVASNFRFMDPYPMFAARAAAACSTSTATSTSTSCSTWGASSSGTLTRRS